MSVCDVARIYTKTFLSSVCALLLLGGCNKPTSSGENPGQIPVVRGMAVYPHTQEFKTTKLHGQFFSADRTSCAKCHGPHGSAKSACINCHAGFPHTDISDWGAPQQHGVQYLLLGDADKVAKCRNCHEGDHPAAGITCQRCHSVFPHADDFITTHGDAYKAGHGKCLICHESIAKDVPQMADQVNCQTCHGTTTNFPHPSGWATPQAHGAYYKKLSVKDRADCLTCHAPDNPTSGYSCVQCHPGIPARSQPKLQSSPLASPQQTSLQRVSPKSDKGRKAASNSDKNAETFTSP